MNSAKISLVVSSDCRLHHSVLLGAASMLVNKPKLRPLLKDHFNIDQTVSYKG